MEFNKELNQVYCKSILTLANNSSPEEIKKLDDDERLVVSKISKAILSKDEFPQVKTDMVDRIYQKLKSDVEDLEDEWVEIHRESKYEDAASSELDSSDSEYEIILQYGDKKEWNDLVNWKDDGWDGTDLRELKPEFEIEDKLKPLKNVAERIKVNMNAAASKIKNIVKHAFGYRPSSKEITNQLKTVSQAMEANRKELNEINRQIKEIPETVNKLNEFQQSSPKYLEVLHTIKTRYKDIESHYNNPKLGVLFKSHLYVSRALNNLINNISTQLEDLKELDAETMKKIDECLQKLNDKKIEIAEKKDFNKSLEALKESKDLFKTLEEAENQIKNQIKEQDRCIEGSSKELRDLMQKRDQLEKYVYDKPKIHNLLNEDSGISDDEKKLLNSIQESITDKQE